MTFSYGTIPDVVGSHTLFAVSGSRKAPRQESGMRSQGGGCENYVPVPPNGNIMSTINLGSSLGLYHTQKNCTYSLMAREGDGIECESSTEYTRALALPYYWHSLLSGLRWDGAA